MSGLYEVWTADLRDSVKVLIPASAGHALVIIDQQRFFARLGGEQGGTCTGRTGSDNCNFIHGLRPPKSFVSITS
ncbi:hypothetical protein D3C74_458100 [compost metagenome]